MKPIPLRAFWTFGTAALLCMALTAMAQTAAPKPIHLVIPFSPGSATDLHARAMSRSLSEALGQQVIVDNRPGAGGTLAVDAVVKSPPDGTFVLMGGSSVITVAPNVYAHLPYDPLKDLAAVTLLTREPLCILARTSLPANTVQELVALARSRPGQLNYASYGSGTLSHLAAELFSASTGVRMTHVPYKGQAPAMVDLMGGQVDVLFTTLSTSLPQVVAGKVKAIAVTTPARIPVAPSVPTLAESGVQLEIVGWTGAFVSAGTPPSLVARLNAELTRINRQADIREGREALGAQAVTSTPQELTDLVRRDLATWAQAVKSAGGIRLD